MKKILWGIGAAALLGMLVIGGIYAVSTSRLTARHEVTPPTLSIPDDSEAIARGEHLLTLSKCGECHGEDLAGKIIIDEPFLARLSGPNLTPAGPLGAQSDADLITAIRYGLSVEGQPLLGMPTAEHFHFSDAELVAMIAALRALPPVERTIPPQSVGLLFRALYLAGEIELVGLEQVDIHGPRPDPVPAEVSLSYGAHLARTGGCYSCHGDLLAGGPMAGAPPDFPPASNITPDASGLSDWSEADFVRSMRQGIRPDGSPIDPAMPWRYTQAMTDAELAALWLFLRSVSAAPYGQH